MTGTWALIPVKRFEEGKSRLSEILNPEERTHLARDLFDGVVDTLFSSKLLDQVVVLSDSPEVRSRAEQMGAQGLNEDSTQKGLDNIINSALRTLEERGAKSAIVCVSDLPRISQQGIARVIRYLHDADVVLVPDLEQKGTNLLALSPPTCMSTSFGHLDSFERHLETARIKGLMTHIHFNQDLGFDVDSPTDYKRMSERPNAPRN